MYRFVEHTSEVELELEATTEAGIFAEATAALGELLAGEGGGEPARHEVSVSARDEAALLAEWLSELVYLADVHDLVPERLERLELAPGRVEGAVSGRCGPHRHLVKAVTYHGLELVQTATGFRARVVLDV